MVSLMVTDGLVTVDIPSQFWPVWAWSPLVTSVNGWFI